MSAQRNDGKAWPFRAAVMALGEQAPQVTPAGMEGAVKAISDREAAVVAIRREFADEVSALAALVDAGLVEMRHEPDWCVCDGTRVLTAMCVRLTTERQHNERQAS